MDITFDVGVLAGVFIKGVFVCAGDASGDGLLICGAFGCCGVFTGIGPFDILLDGPRFGDGLCKIKLFSIFFTQVLSFVMKIEIG